MKDKAFIYFDCVIIVYYMGANLKDQIGLC